MTVSPISELAASMQRHPAGKKRGQTVPEIVYSTATGEQPRGSLTLTEEATAPLPPPEKRVRKTTTKKRRPRLGAGVKPLDLHIKVDARVLAAAKAAKRTGERLVIVDETTVRLVSGGRA